jgi:hypothetical protein
MNDLVLKGILILLAGSMGPSKVYSSDNELVIASKRLHLGKAGQWEWDKFQQTPVDAESLEVRFSSKANPTEQTLRLWQSDVKLTWAIKLNGQRIGALEPFEASLESLFAIPPGLLRDGENVLRIEAPTNGLDDIELGPIAVVSSSVDYILSESRLEVAVSDAATQKRMPCRLTVTKPDGTLQPLRAEPADECAVRTGVVYTRNGKATLTLPPGEYIVTAGRGFEWSAESLNVTARQDEPRSISFELRREVSTENWIAADSHIHTRTYSGHGDASIEERMITIAGEGIELAIATDHNHHTDYGPFQSHHGLRDPFTSVTGNEVTTKRGHFNAFPIEPGAKVVDHQETEWSKLLPAIRATPGVEVITLNHPRDLHSGFIPLGGTQFHPKTGAHVDAEALGEINALEVVTSGALQSDIHLLIRDWFALLNRGYRIAAIASSDTHDVSRFILGQGRTYVAAKDRDPSHLDLEEIWRSYQTGRLLVSMGLMAQLQVDGRFTVGDLATDLGATLTVDATVSGPAWARVDHIALYANGNLIREQNVSDTERGGVKERIRWLIPKPQHDMHLVVVATGPGVESPHWAIPRPYQPTSKSIATRVIGLTNPIWLDADGDGKFQAAYEYASRLLQAYKDDEESLQQELKQYDSSVRTQLESLQLKTK